MAAGKKTMEQLLADEPWYHGLMPREDMKQLLKNKGDFLVRFTDPKPGEPRVFVLSIYVDDPQDDGIRHYVFREKNKKFALDEKWFESIADLLNYHMRTKEPVARNAPETQLIRPIGHEPWERLHNEVTMTKRLGEGAFGEVHMGEVTIGTLKLKAAIKLAKLEALTKEQIKEIMHEARLMRRFKHPNVVRFYGVAAGQEPLMVIMELADSGALDSYLKKNKATINTQKRHEMVVQAARGLAYLHGLQVIHRDIAARNCLYGEGQVKISDFGLSREGTTYKMNPHKKIPIRWLAPEVPRNGCYTFASDVFAFGIMSWEVYHDGEEPYPGMMVAEVLPKVQEGYRMPFTNQIEEPVINYITNKICAGEENERVTMADVVKDYLRLVTCSISPQPPDKEVLNNISRQPIMQILPKPSQPCNMGDLSEDRTAETPSAMDGNANLRPRGGLRKKRTIVVATKNPLVRKEVIRSDTKQTTIIKKLNKKKT